jgi:hypothetical protein
VRVHDPGTVDVNVTNNRSGSEVLVHEIGRITRTYDVPPPELTISCPS